MSDNSQNKRIAKNTLALYFRTFITMIVGLYTSRIMLQALGVDNYGINNVVAGMVAMSSLITGAISSAITRFITYALGEGDKKRMRIVFSTSIYVQIFMSVIAVVVLEIIGMWFLNTQAEIPEGRMFAANCVLQFSIITLVMNLLCTPFNATIVAHENMSIYAYISIVEVMLKLSVCFAIMDFSGDRLIMLSALNTGIAFLLLVFYSRYCRHKFEEARYNYKLFDKSFMKEMFQFTGWYLVGNAVWVFNTQGLNMLINVFFGVALNAARGFAVSVTSAVSSFVTNFTVAFVPQITKSYASGDRARVLDLIFQGTKFTWFLMFIFIIPVFWEADMLLKIWLDNPPEYTSVFLRFALFEIWSINISFALHNTILASGQLRRVQLRVATFTSLIFPITWISYKYGAPAWTSYVVFILLNTLAKGFTLHELKRMIEFPVTEFMTKCVLRCIIVTTLAFALPGLLVLIMHPSINRFLIVVPASIVWTLICVYVLGLNKSEKDLCKSMIAKMKVRYLNK